MKLLSVVFVFVLLFSETSLIAGMKRDIEKPGDGGQEIFRVPFVDSGIDIDAYLDEPIWENAVKIEANIEVRPGENILAPVETEVLIVYDKEHIYVAFIARDPEPSKIRARFCDRDNIFDDDWVLILFDTFNDQRRTYDFACNPLGIQGDMIETPTGGGDAWDAIWNSSGRLTEDGYVVEMSIPFRAFNFPDMNGDQVWGFDAVRSYPRNVRHHIGSFPRDRNNNCYMCQSHKLIGFSGVSPGKNFELNPTFNVVNSQARENDTNGPFKQTENSWEPGLSAKWGITPNMNLNGTLNPDFSNIEADILELDINNQFAIYYPEKRPFFLENSDLFSTKLNLVHTRTLADPDWGVKLSGKSGKNALGVFTAQDRITNFIFPGPEGSQSDSKSHDVYGTAIRYKRDISKSSNLGIILTDREGNNYHNRVGGIDADIKFTPKDRIRFQVIGSSTSYPDTLISEYDQPEYSFGGDAFMGHYEHDTRNYDVYAYHEQADNAFRADLGFITQVGYQYTELGGQYKWQKDPGHWYTLLSLSASMDYRRDMNGNLLHGVWSSRLNYNGPYQSHAHLYTEIGKDKYEGVEYDTQWLQGCFGFQPLAPIFVHLYARYGDQIDYANNRLGTRFRIWPSLQWNLGMHVRLETGYRYEELNVDPGKLYRANTANLKFIYQFNRRMFIRAVMQYINYDRNTDLYIDVVDSVTEKWFNQFLFSYKINPQTVFFLGYSDNYYGDQAVNLTQTNRTIFAKLGYALAL